MKIELTRKNNAVHFEAVNESGNIIPLDGSPAIGGEGKGARPMELLIMGLGGCSSIDIINILKKQKIEPEVFKIEINADRAENETPSLFTNIHVVFKVKAENMDEKKLKRAIDLSMDKYCSVSKILEKTAKITHAYQIL